MIKTIVITLALLQLSTTLVAADSLTLFSFSSPKGVDWGSPKALIMSNLKNYLAFKKNRSIGHVAIELNCATSVYGPERTILAGTRDIDDANAGYLIKEKLGFGILFENFHGQFEEVDFLRSDIDSKLKNGRINFITYLVSTSTCQRLQQYYDEYESNGYNLWYGLPNRPRYGEGAGCSAFGVSFLELAGFLNQEHYDNWSYSINIPLKYIGGDLTGNKVGLLKLLFINKKTRWANADEPHKKIFLWDPDSMFRWTESKVKNRTEDSDYQVVRMENTSGLLYDKREVATPTESIWKF